MAIRRRIAEQKSKLTDEQLFASPQFAAYLTDIAEATTGRYRRKSSVKTYWDALPHADIAHTDNRTITVNTGNFLTPITIETEPAAGAEGAGAGAGAADEAGASLEAAGAADEAGADEPPHAVSASATTISIAMMPSSFLFISISSYQVAFFNDSCRKNHQIILYMITGKIAIKICVNSITF